jgi:hypothetical protein
MKATKLTAMKDNTERITETLAKKSNHPLNPGRLDR